MYTLSFHHDGHGSVCSCLRFAEAMAGKKCRLWDRCWGLRPTTTTIGASQISPNALKHRDSPPQHLCIPAISTWRANGDEQDFGGRNEHTMLLYVSIITLRFWSGNWNLLFGLVNKEILVRQLEPYYYTGNGVLAFPKLKDRGSFLPILDRLPGCRSCLHRHIVCIEHSQRFVLLALRPKTVMAKSTSTTACNWSKDREIVRPMLRLMPPSSFCFHGKSKTHAVSCCTSAWHYLGAMVQSYMSLL